MSREKSFRFALKIQQISPGRLKPYPGNPRKNADAVAVVADLISRFGFRQPIVVDRDHVIVVGHTRHAAALELGLKSVPVEVASDLTAEQARAYRIADNKSNEFAEWDDAKLVAEINALRDLDFDIGALHFSESELSALAKAAGGLTPDDETPEPPAKVRSRLGDVWLLGRHRIFCGDATRFDDVKPLFKRKPPRLMVTDPPYGVDYEASWRGKAGLGKNKKTVKVANDTTVDWRVAWGIFPGDVAYVWHAGKFAAGVQGSLEAAAFEIRAQIIWAKLSLVISRGNYHWQHEPCWYAVRKGKPARWTGDRSQTTLWHIGFDEDVITVHQTQKPVECMRRPIINNSVPGDEIYDPFVGSGTTIIAAETVGRSCLAIDLNPACVDIAVKRWQDFTGGKAKRERDGALFDRVRPRPAPGPKLKKIKLE